MEDQICGEFDTEQKQEKPNQKWKAVDRKLIGAAVRDRFQWEGRQPFPPQKVFRIIFYFHEVTLILFSKSSTLHCSIKIKSLNKHLQVPQDLLLQKIEIKYGGI